MRYSSESISLCHSERSEDLQTVWSSAFRRLRWQNVMLSPGPAKAGTPNSVRPAPKITTECYETSNMTVPLMM
jgi:hypothetical protein